jgi:glutamate--cysteine ligase
MKTIYRIGLAHRYGKLMQTIAGIHFNFSIGDDFWHSWRTICGSNVPLRDFKSEGYFGLVRNVYRYGWLIPYLFGASPAVCQTFLDGRDHHLKLLGESSYYLPYATSLRLSDLGYQSDAQAAIRVNLDSTDAYIESLTRATTESYSPYEAIGLQVDGDYKQLNTSLLQIENEYYAPIRPKRTIQTGEKPTYALRKRGVEYVELRSIDLNPFLPIGIDRSQILFLDIFLLYCLLLDSPPMSEAEQQNCHTTLKQVVERGRDPDLFLTIGNQKLTKLSSSIMSHFKILAEFLDQHGGKDYSSTVRKQQDKFNDSSLTPSAQVLEAMQKYDDNFFNFALAQAVRTGEYFENLDLPAEQLLQMSQDAMDSIDRQRAMEQTDRIGFAEFLERYFNQ